MKLARFWAKETAEVDHPGGFRIRTSARGWSNDSIEAAKTMALQTAQRVASIVVEGRTRVQRYQYGDRPIPEPVIKQFGTGPTPRAIVTCNVYGALVLNANDLMFIDVDTDDTTARPTASLVSGLLSLLGKKPQPAPQPLTTSPIEDTVAQVAAKRGLSLRLYQTAGGYRGIVTNAPQSAVSDAAQSLLRDLGADPLYIHLCKQQESFRARLTPKPWRMKMWEPPVTYPFQTQPEQQRFDRWNADYTARGARFATCRFIKTIGDGGAAPGFQELIDFHDEQTKAQSGLPLA